MNTQHENYLSMALVSHSVVQKYKYEWKGIPRFVTEAATLSSLIDEVNRTARESFIETTGATKDKAAAGEEAIKTVVKLAKPACVYALDRNDRQMHDQLSVSKGSLHRLPDTQLVERLENIYGILLPLKDDLKEYGISESDLNTAKTEIDDLRKIVTHPRELIVERKTKNQTITELIAGLRSTFYRMDNLMKLFEDSEFYAEYRNARIIVDAGKRKKKEEV